MAQPLQKVKLGREARARLSAMLSEEINTVLIHLTGEVRGGTMNSEKALMFVAELARLKGLTSRVDRENQEERRS